MVWAVSQYGESFGDALSLSYWLGAGKAHDRGRGQSVPVHGLEDHIFIPEFLCSPGQVSDLAFFLAHVTGSCLKRHRQKCIMFSLNDSAELLEKHLRPCFGVQTQNPQHPAPH